MSDVSILTKDSPLYPPLLREIAHSPQQLYVKGAVEILSHPHLLAVVGSRQANEYGKRAVNRLLPPLVDAGMILVSGLAHGIDTLAHRACVDRKRPTIAVLGSSLDEDSFYPRANIQLARAIVESGGALVSEYPAGTKALPQYFPARNRIVAGLCRAVVIMQAAVKSGSLITARLALDNNRDVGAPPGSIFDPLAAGTNQLIQQGARPVLVAADIADWYGLSLTDQSVAAPIQLTIEQASIIKKLSAQPQHVDVLIQTLELPPQAIAGLLTELELLGQVEHVGGMRYVKK